VSSYLNVVSTLSPGETATRTYFIQGSTDTATVMRNVSETKVLTPAGNWIPVIQLVSNSTNGRKITVQIAAQFFLFVQNIDLHARRVNKVFVMSNCQLQLRLQCYLQTEQLRNLNSTPLYFINMEIQVWRLDGPVPKQRSAKEY